MYQKRRHQEIRQRYYVDQDEILMTIKSRETSKPPILAGMAEAISTDINAKSTYLTNSDSELAALRATTEISKPLDYIPALDGLRAVSIILVVGHHSALRQYFPFNHGWVGVDAFFVISGYLITALLLREQSRTGRIDLTKFYVRRFLRIVPVFWVWVLCLYLMGAESFGVLLPVLLYISNLMMAFGQMSIASPASVSWSLAIEEQFYLCWPPLVQRCRVRTLVLVLLFTIPAVMVWRMILITWGVDGFPRLNARPDAHMDVILWGCLVALIEYERGFERLRLAIRDFSIALLFGLLVCGFSSFRMSEMGGAYTGQLGFSVNAAVFAGIILWVRCRPESLFTRSLAIWPMVWLGKLSYSMYLWHYVVPGWFFDCAGSALWDCLPVVTKTAIPHWSLHVIDALLWIGLVLGSAVLSYFCVERPFLLLKGRFAARS